MGNTKSSKSDSIESSNNDSIKLRGPVGPRGPQGPQGPPGEVIEPDTSNIDILDFQEFEVPDVASGSSR